MIKILSIQDVDHFFTRLFKRLGEEFTWSTFLVLFVGILLGFVICATIYGVLMMVSIRNEEKIRKDKKLNANPNTEKMNQEVDQIKQNFIASTEGLTNKERFQILGSSIVETIHVVATEYYPESKYPLYELTIEELILFLHYLSTRIEGVFNKTILRPFKKMTVSQIFKFMEVQKQISENKAVKAANKMKLGKVSRLFMGILNYANPVYWFKKLVMGTTINIAMRKICLVIIDIVSDETNKTYSKTIFDKERALRQAQIDETLKNLEGDLRDE